MEQQTISITKAGIQATLNARTSILAAANPTGGRYDKSKPLKVTLYFDLLYYIVMYCNVLTKFEIILQYNVALPPAILSRFDLVYVMIDDPDDTTDYNIANHIVDVHKNGNVAASKMFTTAQLKRYIAFAKTKKPKVHFAFSFIDILQIIYLLTI